MKTAEIPSTLTELFETTAVAAIAPGSWQVETADLRLLILLSDDESWLRVLLPIMSSEAAQPFFAQLLEANFDDTQEVRYALHQDVIWGVFQHNRENLVVEDFRDAIARLISLQQQGLSNVFNQLIENRILEVIKAAKKQGQSLEATLQTLDRFYEEGLMGEMDQSTESREQTLAAWRRQLERLWPQIQP